MFAFFDIRSFRMSIFPDCTKFQTHHLVPSTTYMSTMTYLLSISSFSTITYLLHLNTQLPLLFLILISHQAPSARSSQQHIQFFQVSYLDNNAESSNHFTLCHMYS